MSKINREPHGIVLQPWHVLITILSLLLHKHLQRRIDFLNNQVEELMKLNGKKRILLNDDARRSLAVKGRSLGLKALRELTTIVTPETIMRWHRDLVAKKWDHSHKRNSVGRPRVRQEIVDLVVRIAKENSNWGYDRIQGALSNIGHHIADSTVGNILKDHGIEPAPERQRTGQWSAFLKAHWERLISRPLKFGRLKGSSLITCCLQSLCEPNFVGIAANFGITLATSPLKPPRWWTLNTASLRALSDRTHLRILNLLRRGELCVCDLVNVLDVPRPTASRHLAYLRKAGLVLARKEGLWHYYRLSPSHSKFHESLLQCLATCDCVDGELENDLKQLRKSNCQGC